MSHEEEAKVVDAEDAERVVVPLPRGLVILQDLGPSTSDSWSVKLWFFDAKGECRGGTHFHPSYEREWRTRPEGQLSKLSIPAGDWDHARIALELAMEIRMRATGCTVGELIAGDRSVALVAPSVPIRLPPMDRLEARRGACRDVVEHLATVEAATIELPRLEAVFMRAATAATELLGEKHHLAIRLKELAHFAADDEASGRARAPRILALLQDASVAVARESDQSVVNGDQYITVIQESNAAAVAIGRAVATGTTTAAAPSPVVAAPAPDPVPRTEPTRAAEPSPPVQPPVKDRRALRIMRGLLGAGAVAAAAFAFHRDSSLPRPGADDETFANLAVFLSLTLLLAIAIEQRLPRTRAIFGEAIGCVLLVGCTYKGLSFFSPLDFVLKMAPAVGMCIATVYDLQTDGSHR